MLFRMVLIGGMVVAMCGCSQTNHPPVATTPAEGREPVYAKLPEGDNEAPLVVGIEWPRQGDEGVALRRIIRSVIDSLPEYADLLEWSMASDSPITVDGVPWTLGPPTFAPANTPWRGLTGEMRMELLRWGAEMDMFFAPRLLRQWEAHPQAQAFLLLSLHNHREGLRLVQFALEKLQTSDNPALRAAAVAVLASHGSTPEHVGVLNRLMEDPDEPARAFANWARLEIFRFRPHLRPEPVWILGSPAPGAEQDDPAQ